MFLMKYEIPIKPVVVSIRQFTPHQNGLSIYSKNNIWNILSIQNSTQLTDMIKDIQVNNTDFLISLDISNSFTNVQIPEVLDSIKDLCPILICQM